MNNNELLKSMYEKLRIETNEILKCKVEESVLTTLLNAKSNSVFNVLVNSSLNANEIAIEDLQWAEQNEYIRLLEEIIDQRKAYVLTIKGLWEYESTNGLINTNKLLEFFQEKHLEFSVSTEPLNDKEKIVLFSLLALRAFSLSCSMNLNEIQKNDNWKKIIVDVTQFCKENKLIKSDMIFATRIGHEHPVSYLMRRQNNLSKKTNKIYKSPGDKVYYLNIDDDGKINEEKLLYLWRKVIPSDKSLEFISKLFDFKIGRASCRERV